MIGLDNYTESFRGLFDEAKRYLELQKQYLTLDAAEKITILLSAAATAIVCMAISAMVLLFMLLALACCIGEAVGSQALGFLSTGIILLLMLATVYHKRQRWIIQPIAQLVVSVLVPEERKEDDDE